MMLLLGSSLLARAVSLFVSVNFMTQKLTLEADDAEFDEVLERVVDFTADTEPDCEIIR